MSMIANLKTITPEKLNELLQDGSGLTKILFNDESSHYDGDKAWHAIHFMMNLAVWEFSSLAGGLFLGGKLLSEEDVGYGPARYFDEEEVQELVAELEHMDSDTLMANYNEMLMLGDEIYPSFSDTREDREYISERFDAAKIFCQEAADSRQCLISYMT